MKKTATPRPAGRPMKTFRGDEVGEKKELEKMVYAGFEPWSFKWEKKAVATTPPAHMC